MILDKNTYKVQCIYIYNNSKCHLLMQGHIYAWLVFDSKAHPLMI